MPNKELKEVLFALWMHLPSDNEVAYALESVIDRFWPESSVGDCGEVDCNYCKAYNEE